MAITHKYIAQTIVAGTEYADIFLLYMWKYQFQQQLFGGYVFALISPYGTAWECAIR